MSGYPDRVVAPSIIRVVKQSLEVGNAADQDIYVVVWPWNGTVDAANYVQTANTVSIPGGAAVAIPQVAVYYANTGVNPSYAASPATGLSYPNNMQRGKGRLIGMGLEWINTTAPIARSGTVYCWRQPGTQDNVETLQYLTGGLITRVGAVRRTSPPALNVATVMTIPGTRSWAAEEGCYMVVPFSEDNPPLYPTTTAPLFNTAPGTVAIEVRNVNGGAAVVTGNATVTSTSNRLLPIDTCGAIMTGTGTSFKSTINVVWYYEEFPDEQSDVLTLATPSCEFDSTALQLYCSVMSSLPVAVPSSWNTAGDWWMEVVSAIREHAKSIGGIIGGKPGEVVGMAASTIAGWGQDRYMTSPGSGGSSIPRKLQNNQPRQQTSIVIQRKKPKPKKNKQQPKVVVVQTESRNQIRKKNKTLADARRVQAILSRPEFQ